MPLAGQMPSEYHFMKFRKKDNSGDLQAYVSLMTRHQSNLRAFIVSLIPGSQEVDDVLQETNAVLWKKRDRFQHGTNFIAWAFQIARYEVMELHHRAKRDGRLVFTSKTIDILGEMNPMEDSDEEVLSALDGCLAKLSIHEQKVVRARYTPGLSLTQYAQETGSTPGAMRASLHRIRARLKDCLDRTLGTSPCGFQKHE